MNKSGKKRAISILLGEKFILYFFANLLLDDKHRQKNIALIEELIISELGMEEKDIDKYSPWSHTFIGGVY